MAGASTPAVAQSVSQSHTNDFCTPAASVFQNTPRYLTHTSDVAAVTHTGAPTTEATQAPVIAAGVTRLLAAHHSPQRAGRHGRT